MAGKANAAWAPGRGVRALKAYAGKAWAPSTAPPSPSPPALGSWQEVVPIANAAILDKIHQTYRIQYLKDVVLPR